MQHNRYTTVGNVPFRDDHSHTFTSGFNTKSFSNLHQQDRKFPQTMVSPFSIKEPIDQRQRLKSQYEKIPGIPPISNRPEYLPRAESHQYPSMLRNQSTPNMAMQANLNPLYSKPIQPVKSTELTSIDYLLTHKHNQPRLVRDSLSTEIATELVSQRNPSIQSLAKGDQFDYKAFADIMKLTRTQVSGENEFTKLGTCESVGLVLDNSMSDLKSIQTIFTSNIDSPKQSKQNPYHSYKPVIETVKQEEVPENKNIITERKNNHQRQSANNRDLSLPFNFQVTKQSTPIEDREESISKTDANNYISTINDKNRKISQLESRVSFLESEISIKNQIIQKHQMSIKVQKQSHRQSVEKCNKQMVKLKKQIQLNEVKKHSTNLGIEDKFHKINLDNQQINANNNILQKEIAVLKKDLNKKRQSEDINEAMYVKLKTMVLEKTNRAIEFQKLFNMVNEQNQALKRRVMQLQTKKKERISLDGDKNEVFNEIVKMNEQQNMKYKNNIAVKDEQIHRLEDLNRELKASHDTLKNEIQIEKLKRMTDLKNSETAYKIQEQVHLNEINSLNKVLKSLEEKLRSVVHEDKKKDEFMVTYLKNRVDTPEDKIRVEQFFKQFELLSINTNIVEALQREQQEIETLKAEVRRLILRK